VDERDRDRELVWYFVSLHTHTPASRNDMALLPRSGHVTPSFSLVAAALVLVLVSTIISGALAVRIPPGLLELDQVNFHKFVNSSHTLILAFNGPRKRVPFVRAPCSSHSASALS